jgi:hypothetical protein
MENHQKIAHCTAMVTINQLKETEVVAIFLTVCCVQPHDSRICSLDCLLAVAYSKNFCTHVVIRRNASLTPGWRE